MLSNGKTNRNFFQSWLVQSTIIYHVVFSEMNELEGIPRTFEYLQFVMQITTKDGKIYPIQAHSNEELRLWMQYIHDIIEHLELDNEVGGVIDA